MDTSATIKKKICFNCAKKIDEGEFDAHIKQCTKGNDTEETECIEKICESCGASILSSVFDLHVARCLMFPKEEKPVEDVLDFKKIVISNPQVKTNNVVMTSSNNETGFGIVTNKKNVTAPAKTTVPSTSVDSGFGIVGSKKKTTETTSKPSVTMTTSHAKPTATTTKPTSDTGFFAVDKRKKNTTGNTNFYKECYLCQRAFTNKPAYQTHIRQCVEEDEKQKEAAKIARTQPTYNQPIIRPADSNSNIDFTNPNLGYEELLKLDKYNVAVGLDKKYINQIPQTKMSNSHYSMLSDEDKECMFCMDTIEVGQSYMILPCTHHFHSDEILKWFGNNKTCPICRKEIPEMLS